ncbi:preprotein translocase subunit SecE [Clostridium sp. MSJ-11]|uniref:Protein translocase subunit SecE n=1 Tax=Clostridium mobile TaxID=2841512 RepID=A0ABS6EIH3_9CLOT|nr:preprotein translocase subunit SecE [Clostridium mobile]MBU5485018.1 preprotein translocase subunit SecE [Clostridium mobile]
MSVNVKEKREVIKKENNAKPKRGGIIGFFKGVKGEFKRITWASKEEVKKSTIISLSFCLIYMVAIGLIDFGFNKLSQIIYK